MITAVIMAGGQSARMRASAGPRHKSLVPVLGVPMLERNLCALLSEGFRDIAVAVSAHEPDLERYALGRGRALAKARNARLECLTEPSPLGTIGAVSAVKTDGSVLVVNVDNLTALSLRQLAAFHEATAAAMTIASHVEVMRVPCGELLVVDGAVTAYLEKPAKRISASSGTYVLGPGARSLLAPGCRWDVPALVNTLIARGETVCAFSHDAPWIDVNDATAVAKAEALITDHMDAFERWKEPPSQGVAAMLVLSPSRVLLVRRPPFASRYPELWDLPGEDLHRDDATSWDALRRLLVDRPGWRGPKPEFLASFDDLDVATTELIRHEVFVVHVEDESSPPLLDGAARWVDRECLEDAGPWSLPLRRSLACATMRR